MPSCPKWTREVEQTVWTQGGGHCHHCQAQLQREPRSGRHIDHFPVAYRDIEDQVCCGVRDPRDPRIMIRRDRDGGPPSQEGRGGRPVRSCFVPDRGRDFGPGQGRSNSGYQRRDNEGRGQRPGGSHGGSQGGYSGRPNGGYRGREDDRRPRY